ncbi:MAG: mechanosensitive ion channel family protein [Deltaproteobacteria bacterium]|nr:mechanosensitive ion channel family protein [Deltaproteobacteria bacterium]MBI3078634.1 mechanosensitive ion channel family protein [Deltaproteobacteria bacterium]
MFQWLGLDRWVTGAVAEPSVTFAVVLLVGLLLRAMGLRHLRRWAARTPGQVDDEITQALRVPSLFWVLAVALYVAVDISDLPPRMATTATVLLHALVILSVTLVSANVAGRAFVRYAARQETLPVTGLTQTFIRGGILVVGGLVLLTSLGISITPLITALGVGGLAAALALQDTLSNLFAGVHILMDKPVRVGDYVKLDGGQEGYVVDIGWRTTRIRMLPNNIIIVPNNKLAQSIITNYHLPEERMALLLPMSVSYASDPEHVERVLVEEATRAAAEVPGLLAEPPPFVRFIPGFKDFSLDFTLICQVREYVDQYLAQHELRKRIFRRFQEEGIEIPFPIRTVYLRDERNEKERLGR